ncbi:hypothetical protein Bhyg_03142, partial [Pseudolycoriella hygida]
MAPKNVDDGFIKATSNNVPIVTIQMLAEYFSSTSMYVNNESSGLKTQKSLQGKYGDEAVGRVQIKKSETVCTVVAD